ncbi:MAG TPA: methyltransferase domain-containing protein [Rhodanobacteraceae bacterium]|nr:methyltransferase domain-containing protein [Rhodanobacteraceae bacterium]
MNLARRQLEGELMDDPSLAAHAHDAALHGLRRINLISRTVASLWPTLAGILAAQRGARASLLDVACGGGDVAIAIAQHAQKHGFELAVHGCDLSDTALHHASALAAHARVPVTLFRANILSDPLPQRYTIIISTLFLHHLSDAQIVLVLRRLAAHTDHLVISDLIRGRFGYLLAWFGTRLLSRSPIVHEDGLRSVRAALTLSEARALAGEAGLRNARFERRWPRRFLMTWSRASNGNPDAAG